MKKICKTVLSIWMILAVTVALAPSACLSALAAWGGGTATPTQNGDGYYLIDSGEKLAWFSARVNAGYTSIKGKQMASLDMGSRPFTPIGTATNPFLGVYDGGGYTIANLKVSLSGEGAGLFGYIGASSTTTTLYDDFGDPYTETVSVPSEINNVVLAGANISGSKNVGGIVGSSDGGQILGCSVSGVVSSSGSNVGGVVGYCNAAGFVLNCLNNASVSGTLRVGGIAGYCRAGSTVDGCCNTGTVSGTSFVGGLVGNSSGSDVAHSYNKGAVTASENAGGGLIGYAAYGDLYSLYTIGTAQCPGEFTGIAIGNMVWGTNILHVYYDRDTAASGDNYAIGAEHALMMDSSFLAALNYGKDIFVGDYFHTNNDYPLLRWQLIGWDGSLGRPQTNTLGVYLITSGSELAWFAALVNGTLSGVSQNTAANAKVTRDILLNPGIFDEDSIPWTPIGSEASPYTGTFDGGEYRISGVYIDDTTLNSQGLFGRIGSGGTVKNIFLESSKIVAYDTAGAIAGSNYGTIQNCFNYSYVRSSYYTGGISGSNNGTIENCGNSGEIYGSVSAGGITGANTGGTVTSCFNMAHVYSLQRTGGIIGTNYGVIRYCYNNGKIEGAASTGGVVGYQNSSVVENNFYSCYNIGAVSGAQNVGAVVGYYINGSVTYCYYDTERSGVSDPVATGKPTDQMAGSTLYAFAGFSSDYWIMRASETYFVFSPELRVFYESTNTLLQNTSKNSVAVLRAQYTVMAEVDGELPTYYSTLAGGAAHIDTGAGTLVQMRDAATNVTAEIAGNITVTDNDHARTVSRAVGFDESFFHVSAGGSLTLIGTAANSLTLNGCANDGLAGEALVYVESGGTLTIEDGVVMTDNYTPEDGAAVYLSGGVLQMNGGAMRGNTAARYGGAIYCIGGTINGDGGTIENNSANNGGAIFFEGRTAESTLNALTISGNNAIYGGAIYNRNSSVTITGGTISGNSAITSGGAAYNTGTLIFTGCALSGNTAGTAAGIYQNGTLQLKGAVSFAAADDIYLPTGKTVTNVDRITTSGVIASLTVQNYAAGARVLDGDACAANYAKYTVNVPSGQSQLHINSTGYLIAKTLTNVAMVSKFGSYDVYYTSLKEAVDSIGEDETGLVTMISNDVVEETINVRGNVTVTILGDETSSRTITRYHTCTGSMFTVASGGTLEFGAPGAQSNAALVIDGGSTLYGQYGDSVVTNAGTLRIRDGATIRNAYKNGDGAAVSNSGTLEMSGGIITACTATNGGAIYNTGTAELIGGSITGCTATNGGAIRSGNTLSLQNTTLSGNNATNGGAIYASGTTTLEGGVVQGNTATNGGGVYIAGGTWSLPGGTITVITTDSTGESTFTTQDVTVSILENSADNGGGLYIAGGTGSFSAGVVQGNTAKRGGGFNLTGSAAFTVTGGTIQGNTASVHGGAVFHNGSSFTLQNASVDASNDIYLASGKTLIPAGSAASAVLTPATFAIGTRVLSGSAVASLYSGFTISDDHYFVTADGTLNTASLSPKESSAFHVDYATGFIYGIDPQNNTVDAAIAGFDNAASALTVTNASGAVQAGSAKVCTGFVLTLRSGGTVLDQKTFVLVGDADCDGDCDAEDANIVYALAAGRLTSSQLGSAAYRAADADSNGVVNAADGDLLRACGVEKAAVVQP